MNTSTTPRPSRAVRYSDGGRSYGMPGSVTRTAYLMREKETNTMTMASKAIASYKKAYPDGYDPEVGITLFDHIVDDPSYAFAPIEGFDDASIIFADGSRIAAFGE